MRTAGMRTACLLAASALCMSATELSLAETGSTPQKLVKGIKHVCTVLLLCVSVHAQA